MENKHICAICNKEVKRLGVHIKSHNISSKDYYDQYLKTDFEGICLFCRKSTKFINLEQGYRQFCSLECSGKSEQTRNKFKQTCLKRYGVDSPGKMLDHNSKAQQTCLKKYGNPTFRNSEHAKQTCLEKYGGTGFASKELNIKAKQTTLERYGDSYYYNYEKAKQTCLEKYGGIGFASKELNKKVKQTCLEKYGDANYLNSKQAKITKLERYGDICYNNQEKAKQTCLEKYGVTNPAQVREIQQKAAITRKRTNIATDGTLLDSKWECEIYNFCIKNDIPIERNIPIKFEFEGKLKVIFIDFKIDDTLIEVKGSHLLKGCFDHKKEIKIDTKLQLYKQYNVVLITDYKDLFNNINLKGIDINLFLKPELSFIENNDEKIYWKIIKNILNTKENYITNKQILTAVKNIKAGDDNGKVD